MNYDILCTPGKVAIVLDDPETMATEHLIKPDTAIGDSHLGKVIAVTPSDDYPAMIQVGDRVVIPAYAGAPVRIDGREIHFMKLSDVLAVLHPIPATVPCANDL